MKRLTTAVIALTLSFASYAADQENEDSIVVPPVTITAPRFEQIETAPMRVEMTINVEARGFTVGEGKDVFEHDGDVYRVVSEARTSGGRVAESPVSHAARSASTASRSGSSCSASDRRRARS